jgi:flagellar biosynthetic protein FliR
MHLLVFGSFVKSFEVVALGSWMPMEGSVMALVAKSAAMIGLAVQIAAPFIAFNFIINMSFAVLGKAAPQMNVMVVSFAVLVVGGLLLLVFSMPVVAQLIL